MRFLELREIYFEQEATVFGDLFRSDFRELVDNVEDLVCLFVSKVALCSIMEGDVPEYPLAVGYLEDF
jgi:hypothetical protein